VKIDDDPQNPRDDDNTGTMVCFHKRYTLGDTHDYKESDYSGWDELEKAIVREHDPAVILPLCLYDHSSVTISTIPFSCPFDSGQIGFIYISKKRVCFEYGVKHMLPRTVDLARGALCSEVEAYDQYLRGDTWGYTISDEFGEEYDSCWGFFGEEYCREEAERVVAALEKRDAERQQELIRAQAAMPCCLP